MLYTHALDFWIIAGVMIVGAVALFLSWAYSTLGKTPGNEEMWATLIGEDDDGGIAVAEPVASVEIEVGDEDLGQKLIDAEPAIEMLTAAKPMLAKERLAYEDEYGLSDRLLSSAEVEAMFGFGQGYLAKGRIGIGSGGGIPWIKLGHLVRYRRADVVAFIATKVTTL